VETSLSTFPSGLRLWGLTKEPQSVGQGFTEPQHDVIVLFRTAILLAPGGWASEKEPAKRVRGRLYTGWFAAGNAFPLRNKNSHLQFLSACGLFDLLARRRVCV